ncbi:MAG: hypothetical protein RIQ94_1342 [Pseudomonadota bacterium]|jgi:O-antigen/teichoic acid export membrane protein
MVAPHCFNANVSQMSLKKNVIANYFGQGWTALMSLAFVPVYINYLGIEAYGLVGVFAMLQAWLTLLDMGMTPTLSREMSRYTAGAHSTESIRNLLRTLEVIALVVAIILGIIIWIGATWLATHWLQSEKLSPEVLTQAISIIGLVISLRFIEGLYRSAIVGLQKQVLLNFTGSILATIRSVGAVLILIWVSPSIELFFLWQGIVSLLTIVVFITTTYHYLPSSKQPAHFSLLQLKTIWRFAGGMMINTLLWLLLTQIDKIILSRLLSLEVFGFYTLATTLAGTLNLLIAPITEAYYPRFNELVTQGDSIGLIKIYHQSAQLISLLIIPATFMLVFFGKNILILWTENELLAQSVSPLLTLLVLGSMFTGFLHIPSMLIFAYGWTRFVIFQNIIAVVLLVPLIIWATINYGAIGAAWIWLIMNGCFISIGVHFIHRRLLVTEKWRWYGKDILIPSFTVLCTGGFCVFIFPEGLSKIAELVLLLLSGILMVASAWLVSPFIPRYPLGGRKL